MEILFLLLGPLAAIIIVKVLIGCSHDNSTGPFDSYVHEGR